MKSYNPILDNPNIFCSLCYDLYRDELSIKIFSKDIKGINKEDLKSFKWIEELGKVESFRKDYLGEYCKDFAICKNSKIQLDEFADVVRVKDKNLYKKYLQEIKRLCNYNIENIRVSDSSDLDWERTEKYNDISGGIKPDRVIVFNWETKDLEGYVEDKEQETAPYNITITYFGKVICIIKSRKLEKKNIFFKEFIRRK